MRLRYRKIYHGNRHRESNNGYYLARCNVGHELECDIYNGYPFQIFKVFPQFTH